MTYTQYRRSFRNKDAFLRAFGSMSYEEAHKLAEKETAPVFVKACIMDTWRKARCMFKDR